MLFYVFCRVQRGKNVKKKQQEVSYLNRDYASTSADLMTTEPIRNKLQWNVNLNDNFHSGCIWNYIVRRVDVSEWANETLTGPQYK